MTYLQDHRGNNSSMRLAMLMAVGTGCLLGVMGGIAVMTRIPDGVALATIGAGMVLGAQGWKAHQAQAELKNPTITVGTK